MNTRLMTAAKERSRFSARCRWSCCSHTWVGGRGCREGRPCPSCGDTAVRVGGPRVSRVPRAPRKPPVPHLDVAQQLLHGGLQLGLRLLPEDVGAQQVPVVLQSLADPV